MYSSFRFLIAAASLLLPLQAQAQQREESLIHEIRGGILAHDVDMWAAGSVEDGVTFNGEVAFRSFGSLLGGQLRPAVGLSLSGGDRTSYGYADARWEYTVERFFFGLGLGAAIHDGETDYKPGRKNLGSRVLFHIPIEAGYQLTDANRVSVYFEHVSNAWLADPNPGMDNIGIRLAHRF